MKFVNRAKMSITSGGTSNSIVLGDAPAGFQTFLSAGLQVNDEILYLIEDGLAWEIGKGRLGQSNAVSLLLRDEVIENSQKTTNRLNIRSSGAFVSVIPTAQYFNNVNSRLGSLDSAIETTEQLRDITVDAKTDSETARNGAEAARDQAAFSASQADTFATQAELAALAAGSPIVTVLTDPELADGTVELLKLDAGLQVHEVVAGVWILRGWLIGPNFDTVQLLLDNTAATLGPEGQIVEAEGFRYEVAASSSTDHHVTTAGGVKLYVLPDAAGQLHVEAFGSLTSPSTAASTLSTALVAHAAQGRWLILSSDVLSGPVVATLNGPLRWRFNGGKISLADQTSMRARAVQIRRVSGDIKVENADIDARNFASRCLEVVVSDTAFIETARFASPKMRNGLRTNTNNTMSAGIQLIGDAGATIGVVEITNPEIDNFRAENGNSSRGIVTAGAITVRRMNVIGGRISNVGPRDDGDGIVTRTGDITDLYVQGVHFVDCEKRSIKQQANGTLVCIGNTYERTKAVTHLGVGGGEALAVSHQAARPFYSYGCTRKLANGSFGSLSYNCGSTQDAHVFGDRVEVGTGSTSPLFSFDGDGQPNAKMTVQGLKVVGVSGGRLMRCRNRAVGSVNDGVSYSFTDCDFGGLTTLVDIDAAGSGVASRPCRDAVYTRCRADAPVQAVTVTAGSAPNEITTDNCINVFPNEREVSGGSAFTGRNGVMRHGPDSAFTAPAVFEHSQVRADVDLPRRMFTIRGDVISGGFGSRDSTAAQVRLVVHFHTRSTDGSYAGSVAEYLLTFIKTLDQPMAAQKILVSSLRDATGAESGRHNALNVDTITFTAVADDEVDVFFNSSTEAPKRILSYYAELIQFGRAPAQIRERMILIRRM